MPSAAGLTDEEDQVPVQNEQPGLSGAGPAPAASAGVQEKKQKRRASANGKVHLQVPSAVHLAVLLLPVLLPFLPFPSALPS